MLKGERKWRVEKEKGRPVEAGGERTEKKTEKLFKPSSAYVVDGSTVSK